LKFAKCAQNLRDLQNMRKICRKFAQFLRNFFKIGVAQCADYDHVQFAKIKNRLRSANFANRFHTLCIIIPLRNFNVAEDVIQRQNPWQEIEQDSREVQSDKE
jgi:hypothetical protein